MPIPEPDPSEDENSPGEVPADPESAGSAAGRAPRGFVDSLLVAHPSLKDLNFRRSVLYLSAHDLESGAMGLILNRPLPGRTAADLLPDREEAALLARVPVYLGGPVGRDQLSFAELQVAPEPGGEMHFRHHLTLPEAIALAGQSEGTSGLRAFIGYAGWGGGQLEAEMAQSAWMLVPPRAQFFTKRSPTVEDRTWFRVMGSLGPVYRLLAAVPDELSHN